MNRKDTLDAAAACVLTDRQRTHGPIENSFGLIASLWSAYLSVTVTPFDVAEMMTLLKIARGKGNPLNPDNQVDGAGYQACAAELAESMAAPAPHKPIRYKAEIPKGMAVVRGPDTHSDLVGELLATRVAASTPSDAPAAPQTPPEGDHSQTDAGAQGDAIPDDCDGMWHNTDGVTLTPDELADGWRLLLKDEMRVPDDSEFWDDFDSQWGETCRRGKERNEDDTYRTKAPLPQSPDKVTDAAISEAPAMPESWWHNPDNVVLTDEDKSKGWRFLFVGEPVTPDDTQVIDDQGKWHKLPADFKAPCGTCRTQTPLPYLMHIQPAPSTPPVPEPQWHNPEMIDPSHLTEGRRFLRKDETHMPGDVEVFSHFDKKWATSSSTVRFAGWTYATRAPLPGAPAPEAPVDHNLHQTTP